MGPLVSCSDRWKRLSFVFVVFSWSPHYIPHGPDSVHVCPWSAFLLQLSLIMRILAMARPDVIHPLYFLKHVCEYRCSDSLIAMIPPPV